MKLSLKSILLVAAVLLAGGFGIKKMFCPLFNSVYSQKFLARSKVLENILSTR